MIQIAICEACKMKFITDTPIHQAEKEFKELYPDVLLKENGVTVCEPCFIKIMKFNNQDPNKYGKYIKSRELE